jgi:hypothetical protein
MEHMRQSWLRIAGGISVAFTGMAIGACAAEDTPDYYEEADYGQTVQGLNCTNSEGTFSTMSGIAVAAAQDLGRWQPTRDFAIGRVGFDEALVLTAAAKARCTDGKCWRTQTLLDFQLDAADGKVIFPGGVRLSAAGLRTRLVARFREQQTCESRPANGNTQNCPVEEHTLTFLRAERGGCDTAFFFQAKGTNGLPLRFPAQLKNKLLWADANNNPYIDFQSNGDVVSIDPTWGLNEDGTSAQGTCQATCTKVSLASLIGQCCSCNGVNRTFAKAGWSNTTFLCQ